MDRAIPRGDQIGRDNNPGATTHKLTFPAIPCKTGGRAQPTREPWTVHQYVQVGLVNVPDDWGRTGAIDDRSQQLRLMDVVQIRTEIVSQPGHTESTRHSSQAPWHPRREAW